MDDLLKQIASRVAKTVWVILVDKGQGPTLVQDRAMNKPYSNRNRKVCEDTAKIISKQYPKWKLEVRNLEDAFNYLKKFAPKFEKDLMSKL